MILVDEYFEQIEQLINTLPDTVSVGIEKRKIDDLYFGIIHGTIKFSKSYTFEFLEVINTDDNPDLKKIKYKFQLMKPDQILFRYDCARHFPEVDTFPHHKHLSDGSVTAADEPGLRNVIFEIIKWTRTKK